ncbi:TatD DNase family protein [Allopseudospirillum japonicum]|uniref:TatD DNase family protein n=1 Tax=Allopseudospirillum japonicum TaxID=64971 RepID=A0A1H6S026_9GAMM|nr:TatD family hydrolase [Allopseudospirillum japonicum]SEI61373.1 TatD DNase family protein [Allopseudospirillum japonicum]
MKNTLTLVDSHCHLDMLKLAPEALDQRLAEARARGVAHFLCVSVDLSTWPQMLLLAQRYPDVSVSLGVHPLYEVEQEPSLETLCALAKAQPRVVAIGETGLDSHYTEAVASEVQEARFYTHLQAGRQLQLPVIVHTREAKQATLAILRQGLDTQASGVLHCFTEDWDMAKAALDLGMYISLSGIVTFKNAQDLREVARRVPLDRLLIETDAPYLAPVPYRGKVNQPAYVYEVAQCIADARGISLPELATATTENFYRLFQRASPIGYPVCC